MTVRLSRSCSGLVLALVASLTTIFSSALISPPAAQATIGFGQTSQSIVVKLEPGQDITALTASFGLAVEERVLASRGIYLVRPLNSWQQNLASLSFLALRLRLARGVVYAEIDQTVALTGARFHGWPDGLPRDVSTDPTGYLTQYGDTSLQLATVRRTSSGRGARIAVLDTGADLSHPALQGRAVPGWNYIDDDADISDTTTGTDTDDDGLVDSAVGHGTFVAGLVGKVAPDAQLRIYKVLNSDGFGSYYEVAQAIIDATKDGAQVISMSFGTGTRSLSRVLSDAVDQARRAGVLVVAAAGNTGDNQREYPAAESGVLSVSALDESGSLADFSGHGDWVDVAAPGENLDGPLPGGAYGAWAGTSMATSIVAGQAAVLIQTRPGVKQDLLYRAITESARSMPRNTVRYGSVDIVRSLAWLANRR